MATELTPLTAADFGVPNILLYGPVDHAMYHNFRQQLVAAPQEGLVIIELSTLGGDPEVARMMGEDIRFHSDMDPQRRFVFLGKAAIYSAGTTLMSFFTKKNRYLTRGTRIMIHERLLTKTLQLSGPLTACAAVLRATLNEAEASIAIQNEGFANLIEGSNTSMEEVLKRAPENWYVEANEAQVLGLVEAVI
jgi:ATP-dependent protease ClpP protease subunit